MSNSRPKSLLTNISTLCFLLGITVLLIFCYVPWENEWYDNHTVHAFAFSGSGLYMGSLEFHDPDNPNTTPTLESGKYVYHRMTFSGFSPGTGFSDNPDAIDGGGFTDSQINTYSLPDLPSLFESAYWPSSKTDSQSFTTITASFYPSWLFWLAVSLLAIPEIYRRLLPPKTTA